MINFVTVADAAYFTRVCGLIGSIIQKQPTPYSISVYNIGLKPRQVDFINSFPNVKVRTPHLINPDMLKPMRSHMRGSEAVVTGLYSWKPAIITQEFERVDNLFYLDAGTSIVQDVSPIVEHSKRIGYFFLKTNTIGWMATEYVQRALLLTVKELYQAGINAGIQCLDKTVFEDYVLPVCEMARNIELFKDDGTAIGGYDSGRHDQTLFSIQAARQCMLPFESNFKIDDKDYNIVDLAENINENTLIYHCRGNSNWGGDLSYIKQFDTTLFK